MFDQKPPSMRRMLFISNVYVWIYRFFTFFRPVVATFREFNRKKYEQEYLRQAALFPIGSIVRMKKVEQTKMVIAPSAQDTAEELGFRTKGEADEFGCMELYEPPPQIGTLSWSLFEVRDEWEVIRPQLNQKEFVESAIWWGLEVISFTVLIKPVDDSRIAWPDDVGYGKNVMWMDIRGLEKVSNGTKGV